MKEKTENKDISRLYHMIDITEEAIPPGQCTYRREVTWKDKFWLWWTNIHCRPREMLNIDAFVRCCRYEGHGKFGYDHEFPYE
jgi:hypothetical protein